MKKKKWTRISLAITLVALFLFNVFPASAAAVPQKEEFLVSAITEEAVDLRGESWKQFLCEDGSILVAGYGSPVHYEQNGEWKEIDNSLALNSRALSASGKATYTPKASALSVRVPQDLSSGQQVTVSSKGYTFGFGVNAKNPKVNLRSAVTLVTPEQSPSAMASRQQKVAQDITTKSQNKLTAVEQIEARNAEKMTLDNLSSAVVYKNMFPNADLEYQILPDRVKENIVVAAPQAEYIYRFDVSMNGLAAIPQEDGSILLVAASNPKEVIFTLEAPYMYDAAGEASEDVKMVLKDGVLTVTASTAWLNDEARAWPVVIDPTVIPYTSPQNSSVIQDNYVSSVFGNTSYPNKAKLYAGKTPLGEKTRTYVMLNYPQIQAGSVISNAKLELQVASDGSTPLYVYDLELSPRILNINTVTWNNQPIESTANNARTLGNPVDYRAADSGSVYRLNITSALKNWYEKGKANKGLVLTTQDENTVGKGQISVHSTEASLSKRPVLSFNYTLPELSDSNDWQPGPLLSTKQISVIASSWNASVVCDGNWLKVTPASGVNGDKLTMKADPNTTGGQRSGTVTVRATKAANGPVINTIAVVQSTNLQVNRAIWVASDQEKTSPAINITGVESKNWSITKDPSATWLNLSKTSGTGNTNFTIIAAPNDSGLTRTGTVTVATVATPTIPAETKTITVTQLDEVSSLFTAVDTNQTAFTARASTTYYHRLTKFTAMLSEAAYRGSHNQNGKIETVLAQKGFGTYEPYNYVFDCGDGIWDAGSHSIAYKNITGSNGPRTLIVVTIRGTGGLRLPDQITSIASAALVGVGYKKVADDVRANFDTYVDAHKSNMHTDRIVLVTGHSLGGAAANLLANNLDGSSAWGVNKVYAYTFGAPGAELSNVNVRQNIFNIINTGDTWYTKVDMLYGRFGYRYQRHGLTAFKPMPTKVCSGDSDLDTHLMPTYRNTLDPLNNDTTWANLPTAS